MKVALYCRCSTKKQDLEGQRSALIKWAKEHDHQYTLFEDFAISGKKEKREGITRLLAEAEENKFDFVGVVELSRIGRSISFIHKTVEDLSKLDIKLVLVNSNTTLDYVTLEGRALIGGLSLAADIEWMLIKERNERGRQVIKEKGIKVGRKQKVASMAILEALREKGMSLRDISKETGISPATILRRFKSGRLCNVSESNEESNRNMQNQEGNETVFQLQDKEQILEENLKVSHL